MSLILHQLQQQYPDLEIHQVEVGVPEQFQRLVDGRLDVGIGRASLAPQTVASELFRLDPLGVLVAEGHLFAARSDIPVATLAAEPMLLSEETRAPEFNQSVLAAALGGGLIGDPAGVIGIRDEPCSDPPFPRSAQCGFLRDALNHVRQHPPTNQWRPWPSAEPVAPASRR
jgi:DNA-binding transcriptional LysR family regulator